MSKQAAEHHTKAARTITSTQLGIIKEAAKHHQAGNDEKTVHHTQVAHGHHLHAMYHHEEATIFLGDKD
jgi:hypothetical protein